MSNATLNDLLKVVLEEKGKAAFDKFCKDIMACIHECFSHFRSIMPQLAKVRAHRDFHLARVQTIPGLWLSLTSIIGVPNIEPLDFQSVNRQLFNQCMQELFLMLTPPTPAVTKEIKLLADEENSIRLASGYVGMKLFNRFGKNKGMKASQYRECLSDMSKKGDDSSFYAYTTEWIQSIDRGGLFSVSDSTFNLFKAIEVRTKAILPEQLACLNQQYNKDEVIHTIIAGETVQLKWKPVRVNVMDEEDASELLFGIVEMWVTVRGFSITSKWMEEYKQAKEKVVKKKMSLRKELQAKLSTSTSNSDSIS